jgi:hypothetical protein
MTYLPSTNVEFTPVIEAETKKNAARARGLFGSVFAALIEGRQARVDRQIAEMIARSGGKLTDELEREIGRHLAGH